MFGMGTSELIIILVIVMVIFGASRLPALGKGLGSGMRNFRDALRGTDEEKKESASIEKAPPAEPKQEEGKRETV